MSPLRGDKLREGRLADIAGQLERPQRNRAQSLIIDGGLNDLFGAAAPIRDIERDFRGVQQVHNPGASAIFTLMPYIAQREAAPRIDAANAMMAGLCRERGIEVLDLNPHVSLNGVRRAEMSDDGCISRHALMRCGSRLFGLSDQLFLDRGKLAKILFALS